MKLRWIEKNFLKSITNKMKSNMNIYYDEEADFLEIGIDSSGEGYFKDVGEEVSERIDRKTGKVVGIAIMSFKKRTENMETLEIPLPVKLEIS